MTASLKDIRAVLETTPQRWQQLVRAVSEEMLSTRPLPAEWSPLECLLHLIDTESIFPARVEAILAGRDFPAFDPDRQGTRYDPGRPASAYLAEFTRLRRHGLATLARVQPQDLERGASHAELGPVKLVELLNEWAAHDLDHTIQAERALMQPFIRACGPWQVFFRGNLMRAEQTSDEQ